MYLRKLKSFVYIILLFFIFSFILSFYSLVLAEDSIYVWSNNSSSVTTSISPSETQENSSNLENISRELSWNYFWRCNTYRSKNR